MRVVSRVEIVILLIITVHLEEFRLGSVGPRSRKQSRRNGVGETRTYTVGHTHIYDGCVDPSMNFHRDARVRHCER